MKHSVNHTGFVMISKTLYCHPKLDEPWLTTSISIYSNNVRVYSEYSSKVEGARDCREEIKNFLAQGAVLDGGRTMDDGVTVAEFKMMRDV